MTRKEEFWTLYTRYMRLGAKLHKARPGDGAYHRNRLFIYTGLSGIVIDGSYLIGHTWKGWCACCGAETIACYALTKEADRSTPAIVLVLGNSRDEPRFHMNQRCKACLGHHDKTIMHDRGRPYHGAHHQAQHPGKLPYGYSPAARRALKAAGLPLDVLEREGHHYRFYDRDERPWLLSDQERDMHARCEKIIQRTRELC